MAVKKKFFYKIDSNGVPVPGMLIARNAKPTAEGKWRKLFLPDCCGTFADRLEGVTTDVEDLDAADLTQDQWKAIIELALGKIEGY